MYSAFTLCYTMFKRHNLSHTYNQPPVAYAGVPGMVVGLLPPCALTEMHEQWLHTLLMQLR